MKSYEEYKADRQKEFNSLPIFWAFSNEQFKKAMNARGLAETDTDKIYSFGHGGYYLRADAPIIEAYMNKPDELPELMRDFDFAESAIYYEMCNHEYGINWQGDWDVCSAFGNVAYSEEPDELKRYFDQLGWCEITKSAYIAARRRYFKDADENGWF